jgi:hypothetical protein
MKTKTAFPVGGFKAMQWFFMGDKKGCSPFVKDYP